MKFKLSLDWVVRLMKLVFTISILQLLFICLCFQLYETNPIWAYQYLPSLSKVPVMLEHAAMSALIGLVGGYIFEYAMKHSECR